jgi:hypothetical protein
MALDGYVRVAKHAGLDQREALLDALTALEGNPAVIADALRRHHLIGLVRSRTTDGDLRACLPPALLDALASRKPVGRLPAAVLLAAYAEVRRAFEADGLDLLVLKGFYFAERLYGGIDRRPQHDLDVLVRPRDFRRALASLRALGFERRKHDLHSTALNRDDLQVDVHRHLRWAPAFAIDEAALWRTALDVVVQGTPVRTLSDDYTLVFLLLAAFEDLGQGLVKLKQLLDLHLLLRAMDATTDWEAFFARRSAENLLAIAVNVLAVCMDVFEARAELPALAAALDRRGELRVLAGRDEALRLVGSHAKNRESLVWFGRVYPGSLAHWLVWFWAFGFPGNLVRLRPDWVRSHARVLVDAGRARGGRATEP